MLLVNAFWKFLRRGNSTLDCWGVSFWSICGFFESPRDFFGGVDFCSHSIIPFNWNPDYPPPPLSWDFSDLDKAVLNSNTQLCLFPLLC